MAFAYKNIEYTLYRTARSEYDLKGEPWNSISHEAIDLISRLLDPNPETRIELGEALNHKWFEVVAGKTSKKRERKPIFSSALCDSLEVDSVEKVRSSSTEVKGLAE
jgi:serine/threonine protein kinase